MAKPTFFSDKFNKWKDAVHKGVEQIIEGMSNDSKKILRQQKYSKDEDKTFEGVANSWYHEDTSTKMIHEFGYDHPNAETIEFGESRFVQVGPKKEDVELVDTPPRRFITSTVQEYMGNKSAQIIIKSVEEGGLDEKI